MCSKNEKRQLSPSPGCCTVVAAPAASTARPLVSDLREFLSSSSLRPRIGAGISEETTEAHLWLLFDECVDGPGYHDKPISLSGEFIIKDQTEDLALEDAMYRVTALRQRLDLRFDRIADSKTGGSLVQVYQVVDAVRNIAMALPHLSKALPAKVDRAARALPTI